jgi:hypothetical protein
MFLHGERPDIIPPLGVSPCKTCEYRDVDPQRDGFAECWGPTPPRGANVIDLYRAGNGSNELKDAVAQRVASGKLTLVDLPGHLLDGGGSYGAPRRNQMQAAVTAREVVGEGLATSLGALRFPLHFIDFEASRIPVPYVAGMKPYEVVAFQFSCHTVASAEAARSADPAALVHREWLNLRDVCPNEEFLHELRAAIGDEGTVLTWSGYELTTLRHVRRQLRERKMLKPDGTAWLEGLIGPVPAVGEEDKSVGKRVADMLKISQAHYAHPLMRGAHGIKKVLDAIWSDAPHLWSDPRFEKYFRRSDSGAVLDPYDTLTLRFGVSHLSRTLAEDDLGDESNGDGDADETNAITDGVGAMRAYQELLYGMHRDDSQRRDTIANALRAYCELDTAAMVIVWTQWMSLLENIANSLGSNAGQ